MRYVLILRHDADYTQAVRPDVLKRLLGELDELHRLPRALAWETWSGPANAMIRVSCAERGFVMEEEETEEYVDSLVMTIDSDGVHSADVRDAAWRLASHITARLKWEMFDTLVGRTLLSDERMRFENSLADWARGFSGGSGLRSDHSAGPGAPRVGG